jgi:sporulation protein YlmC with PRC-barrel domain
MEDQPTADTAIAWAALEQGTPIVTSDGEEIGKVATVVADEQKDIFSGVTFRPGALEGERFLPAVLIERLTAGRVLLGVDRAGAEARAEPYEA